MRVFDARERMMVDEGLISLISMDTPEISSAMPCERFAGHGRARTATISAIRRPGPKPVRPAKGATGGRSVPLTSNSSSSSGLSEANKNAKDEQWQHQRVGARGFGHNSVYATQPCALEGSSSPDGKFRFMVAQAAENSRSTSTRRVPPPGQSPSAFSWRQIKIKEIEGSAVAAVSFVDCSRRVDPPRSSTTLSLSSSTWKRLNSINRKDSCSTDQNS